MQVDTTNILFICGGAFDGLEKIIRSRSEKTGIGFGAEVRSLRNSKDISELLKGVEPEDLIKYGLIPEFVGRLPVVATLEELDENGADPDPHRAEERADQAVPAGCSAWKASSSRSGRRRSTAIAHKALARKTGARGLRSILEQVLLDIMFELPTLENVSKVVVDEPTILGDGKPLLIYSDQPKVAGSALTAVVGGAPVADPRGPLEFRGRRPHVSAISLSRGDAMSGNRTLQPIPVPVSAAAAAGRGGLPAHGDPAVRRPPEVDQGDGNRDGSGQEHPARRAEVRGEGRAGAGGHVRDRLHLEHPADAEAARRHGEGAGRGQPARARSRTSPTSARTTSADGGAGAARSGATTTEVEAMRRALHRAVRPVREAEQEDPARDPHLARRHRGGRAGSPTPSPRTCRSSSSRSSRCSRCSTSRQRLEHLLAQLETEIDILQVEKRIRGRVKRQMEKSQREYYLNEQVKAIQKELGEGEEGADLEEMEKRIKAARMPKDARQEGGDRAEEAAPDVADVGRGDRGAQLHRDARQPAVEEEEQDLARTSRRRRRSSTPTTTGWRRSRSASSSTSRCRAASTSMKAPILCLVGRARRRQDLARPVDRARHQPQVRAHVARRRARRGRDPRPPPHLHRLDAGQDPAEHDQGRREEPAVPARRGRQDGHGLPRRPVVGAARGARPGAEPHLRRPLRRGRVRPVGGDVRRHREHAEHPAGAARPHGSHPALGLHRGREGQHRHALPAAQADEEQRR